MPVQSLECTLTQAQMKRYLAGADYPEEILVALERHLKVCPDCLEAASVQRQALGGAPISTTQAVVSAAASASPLDKVKALIPKKKGSSTPPSSLVGAKGEDPYSDPMAAIKSPKNVVLSVSLCLVLLLMSTVLRNPTSLFGPRASSKISPSPAKEEKAAETEKAEKTDESASETATEEHGKDSVKEPEKETAERTTTHADTHSEEPSSDHKKDESKEHATKENVEPPKVATHTTNLTPKTAKTSEHGKEAVKKQPKPAVGGAVVIAEAKPPVAKPTKKAEPSAVSTVKNSHPAPKKRTVSHTPKRKPIVRKPRVVAKRKPAASKSTWQRPRIKIYQP